MFCCVAVAAMVCAAMRQLQKHCLHKLAEAVSKHLLSNCRTRWLDVRSASASREIRSWHSCQSSLTASSARCSSRWWQAASTIANQVHQQARNKCRFSRLQHSCNNLHADQHLRLEIVGDSAVSSLHLLHDFQEAKHVWQMFEALAC